MLKRAVAHAINLKRGFLSSVIRWKASTLLGLHPINCQSFREAMIIVTKCSIHSWILVSRFSLCRQYGQLWGSTRTNLLRFLTSSLKLILLHAYRYVLQHMPIVPPDNPVKRHPGNTWNNWFLEVLLFRPRLSLPITTSPRLSIYTLFATFSTIRP